MGTERPLRDTPQLQLLTQSKKLTDPYYLVPEESRNQIIESTRTPLRQREPRDLSATPQPLKSQYTKGDPIQVHNLVSFQLGNSPFGIKGYEPSHKTLPTHFGSVPNRSAPRKTFCDDMIRQLSHVPGSNMYSKHQVWTKTHVPHRIQREKKQSFLGEIEARNEKLETSTPAPVRYNQLDAWKTSSLVPKLGNMHKLTDIRYTDVDEKLNCSDLTPGPMY